jgi:hypothetical protein
MHMEIVIERHEHQMLRSRELKYLRILGPAQACFRRMDRVPSVHSTELPRVGSQSLIQQGAVHAT